ncbi:alanine racemase [Acinetobacter sp. UBA3132]|uniref:alanine racemase n=1 Tax=Acinetobacter sp. UBA3132 TaxID=1945937 RepID=UPI0025798E55|nr:alanine racemase [Acinetobacter sp. UBA3132]
MRQATVYIDNTALQYNLNRVKQLAPTAKIVSMVKANAYGHGVKDCLAALKDSDAFGVACLQEALEIRELGYQQPITLIEGIFSADEMQIVINQNIEVVVHHQVQLDWLMAHKDAYITKGLKVWVKLNSGMNRLGFQPHEYAEIWQELHQLNNVRSITHMTHFSDADGERFGLDGIEYQNLIFSQTIHGLEAETSLSNSAAILRHHQSLHSDIVRSGIMLYGSSPDYPSHSIQDWNLQPSMSLRSEIIAIQNIQVGQSVGYGSNFVAEQAMRIGVVACGYADGYQRISQTGTPVLVDGVRTQTIGRVSMDMLTVDLTELSQTNIGSEVVLWGRSTHGTVLPIDEVAAGSGTVGYELMCGITARVPVQVET